MRLQFLGANRQVTGSRYLLEAGGMRLIVDCGLFQERKFQDRNWGPPPVEPRSVDALLLTHAHLDHTGLIPKFVREGFAGDILCTSPTVELTSLVLRDSAKIQEEDAAFKKARHEAEGRGGPNPEVPLYTIEDAEAALRRLKPVNYGEPVRLNDRVSVTYHDAGHILGSAMLEIVVTEGGASQRIAFSGDLGQWGKPLIGDPTILTAADFVVMESTYGDKDHEGVGLVEETLAGIVNDALAAGGNLVIPTFAIERPQELLYHLARLVRAKKVPRLMVFLDSPMAVNATEIYYRHPDLLDEETRRALAAGEDPMKFPSVHLARTTEQSKAINQIRGTAIIMAGSGMCTGGRIKHHLAHNLERQDSTILFVGYQAEDTLGRQIVDGSPQVRVLGRMLRVRARVRQLHGMSAHADRKALLRWLDGFQAPPKRLFLTHGEEAVSLQLAAEVERRKGWPVRVPEYLEAVDLS